MIIVVICLVGLLVGSVFGIFFSGEDSGNGMTMQTVVREINTEYDTKLDEIKNGTAHDVLEMSGSRAVWKEVLELPELSNGGAKAEIPKCPGMIPMTPPPTPVLAGIPEVYNQSPVRS